jgi:hypothetical protein
MDVEIGTAAGDVYRFLEVNGPSSAAKLRKGTGHKDTTVHQALGWLAREDKIVRETSGRSVVWTLGRC